MADNSVITTRPTSATSPQLSDLQVAALNAKSTLDKQIDAARGGDPDANSPLMQALNNTWDERRGLKPAAPPSQGQEGPGAEGEQAGGDEGEASQTPAQELDPSSSRVPKLPGKPQEPRLKAKTAAEWKAAKAASEQRLQEAVASARAEALAQVEAQQKELSELRQWRQLIDIQNDPEFQREFTVQQESLARQVKNIAGKKGTEIAELLSQPMSASRETKLAELLTDLPDTSQRMVRAVFENLAGLEVKKQMRLDAARAEAEHYVARKQQEARLQAQLKKQTFEKVLGDAVTRGLEVFNTSTKDPKHNKQAQTMRAQAESYYSGQDLSDSDRATIALWATLGPKYAESYEALLAEHSTLQSQLAELQGTLPGAGETGGESSELPAPRGKDPSRMSTEELQADMMKKLEAAQKNMWSELRKTKNFYGA